jgi:N-acyl-D-aspartate/D-glutamate deacylase
VARILARFNATYASHTRFGAAGDPTGGREAIAIGERAGCRVQISHFVAASAEALEMVSEARARGLQVAADIIPSSLSHRRRSDRMLEALCVFSPGMFDKSLDELRAYIRSPEGRANAAKSVQFFNTPKEQMVVVRADTARNRGLVGKSVAAIGREQGRDPVDVLAELVLDEQNPVVFTFDGDRRQIAEPSPQDLERRYGKGRFLARGEWTKHPLFMPGSDTIPIDAADQYGWYEQQRRGAFPAYFEQARSHDVPLEQAVSKATSLAASQFGLNDRGMLVAGRKADIVVFNPAQYKFPSAGDSDPNVPGTVASGVGWVVVNGTIVLDDGKLTGSRPGRVLLQA